MSNLNAIGLTTLFLSLFSVMLVYVKISKMKINFKKKHYVFLTCVCVLVNISLLVYITFNFSINDVSDPLNVQVKATELSRGNYNWHTANVVSQEYFYSYPNMAVFTILVSKLIIIGERLGISGVLIPKYANVLMIIGLILISLLTIWQITKKWKSLANASLLFLILPILYLYPNVVFYTDTPTMILTALLIYDCTLVLTSNNLYVNIMSSIMLPLIMLLLYMIKPNMIIVLPAMFILILISVISKMGSSVTKRLMLMTVLLVVTIVSASPIQTKIQSHYGFNTHDRDRSSLPITHWINMGMNNIGSNGQGSYDLNDDNNDRNAVQDNKKELIGKSVKHRLKKLGIGGVVSLWFNKSQQLLGTSLFGYGKYQAGWRDAPSWYIKHQGMVDAILSIISLTVLFASFFKIIFMMLDRNFFIKLETNQQIYLMFIGLMSIGLVSFHIFIWEVEPRYFLPLLYPLMLLSSFNCSNSVIKVNNFFPTEVKMKDGWKQNVTAIVIAVIFIFFYGASFKQNPSVAFGNMQYYSRIPVSNSVKLPPKTTFYISVPQNVNVLKINIPYQKGLLVKLGNGEYLKPTSEGYVINHVVKKQQKLKVQLLSDKGKTVTLYKELTMYKQVFNGSSIKIKGSKYYLPYEMEVYDKYPSKPSIGYGIN